VFELAFARLEADDMLALQAGRTSRVVFGMPAVTSLADAKVIAAERVAWSARARYRNGGEQLLACFGIVEHFAGVHGLAWAMLADHLGSAHLPLTRFVRSEIARCGLPRLELLARAPNLEDWLALHPGLDSGQIVAIAGLVPTPEMRWAQLLGMTPAHVLRLYGGGGESFMLYERLAPELLRPLAQMGEAA
jgi:hypothetical protein